MKNPYNRQNPSPRYQELLRQYAQLHREGEHALGISASETFPGFSMIPNLHRIKALIERTHARTLLDYGAGKGQQYLPMKVSANGKEWPSVIGYFGVDSIYCYDPGYPPFSELPQGTFDGVVCSDVLEHCPEDDLPWILREMFSYANGFVFANVASYKARKQLPNGENAHCTIRPVAWWDTLLRQVAAEFPNVTWEVWAREALSPLSDDPQNPEITEHRLASF